MFALRHVALPCLAVLLVTTTAEGGKVPTRLTDAVRRAGSARVLVQLDESVAAEGALPARSAVIGQRARIAASGRRLATTLGGTGSRVLRAFETVPFAALDVDEAGLDALEQADFVVAVEEDRLSFPILDESVPQIEANAVHLTGYDGSGQTIAILDTGVDSAHPFLAGRVVSESCFSSGDDCPNGSSTQTGAGAGAPCTYAPEDCAHGTHVAGIAAGAGESFTGVAPGADLISIQIFTRFNGAFCGGATPCAASFTSDQVAALERVLTLADIFPIAAVNMSIGGAVPFTSASACDEANAARKAVIDHLRSIGIVTVGASGNERSADGLTSPACISTLVSVGATTAVDTVAGFSNSAAFLTLLAPGVGIDSSVPGDGFRVMNGTSMAAPHVSGAFALLRQQSTSASVTELVEVLRATGVPVLDARNGVIVPRISLLSAVAEGRVAPRGLLEFPLDGRYATGIGAFTAWLCDAKSVLIRVDGGEPMVAAYGTPRDDTKAVCGDADNGVSLLYNFNRDGNGLHTAELIADGVVVSTSTYTVSTFGVPFLRGADEKTYILQDFEGHDVSVKWLTERQGFEIIAVD
ncbi:MAG: S8 family serine peptidase [Candidatus Binatia bacterium]|nr:S8 family serine peptidase [Candidatus Binatia bacterium]